MRKELEGMTMTEENKKPCGGCGQIHPEREGVEIKVSRMLSEDQPRLNFKFEFGDALSLTLEGDTSRIPELSMALAVCLAEFPNLVLMAMSEDAEEQDISRAFAETIMREFGQN